jgi:hypothetical protein
LDLDLSNLSNLVTLLSTWGAAFLIALWLSLIYWAWRDAKSRIKEARPRFLALLIVIILFIPGVLIYLLLRPQQTLEEEYLRTLEEEALLRAIEESEAK